MESGSLIKLLDLAPIGAVAVNALSVALLAVLVALASRWVRSPATVHVLWLLVLVKLVTPPLLEVSVLPARALEIVDARSALAWTPPPAVDASAAVSSPAGLPVAAASQPSSWPLSRIAGAVWLLGSLLLLLTSIVRALRFQRRIAPAENASDEIREIAARVASRLGLRSPPPIRILEARISPLVWFPLRTPTLLLPRALVDRLPRLQLETILAHELAHIRRGDHWVRYLELLVTTLFWWHPVVWWARRELRLSEERSCDAAVLEAVPGGRRAYARGLVETIDFLSGPHTAAPTLAVGAAHVRDLETRLTMIMKQAVPRRLNAIERLALSAVVIGSLLVFPTWGERAQSEPQHTRTASDQAGNDLEKELYREQLFEVEHRMQQLQQELKELAQTRNEIEQRFRETMVEREHDELRSRAERLEVEGRAEEAELLRRELAIIEEQRGLERQLREVEADRAGRMGELKLRIHEALAEADRLEQAGRLDEAREHRREAEHLEQSLFDARDDSLKQLSDLKRAQQAAELAAAVEYEQQLRREGRHDEAAKIEAKLMYERARALELEQRKSIQIEKQLAELRLYVDKMEAEGRTEDAENARRKVRELLKKRDAQLY